MLIINCRLQDLSVILVIPDYFDRFYVRELANVLLVQMGFSQLCVQQVREPVQSRGQFYTFLRH
jgi:hypothetical protein